MNLIINLTNLETTIKSHTVFDISYNLLFNFIHICNFFFFFFLPHIPSIYISDMHPFPIQANMDMNFFLTEVCL